MPDARKTHFFTQPRFVLWLGVLVYASILLLEVLFFNAHRIEQYFLIFFSAHVILLGVVILVARRYIHARTDLQRSHSQYTALVGNIPGTVFRCEAMAPWRITFMRGTHEVSTGQPVEHYLDGTLSYSAQIHPADVLGIDSITVQAIAAHSSYTIEYRVRHRDGGWRWASMYCSPVYSPEGVPLHIDGIIFDITERQKTQQELKNLTNHLPLVVYRYRLENNTQPHLIYMSEGVQRLVGCAANEVIANPYLLFSKIHPEDWPRFVERDLATWQEKKDFSLEFRFYMPDGNIHWLLAHSSPFTELDGSIIYQGFIEDITTRKQSELKTQESESLLQQIFDTSNVAIFLVDKKGMITLANQRMAEMLHCSLPDLVGSFYVDHVDPAERAIGHQKMLELLNSDINFVDLERLYWCRDGTTFWGNLSGKRFHSHGGDDLGLLGVIMDITDRKRAEEEIRNLAFYDVLTGLPNRRLLLDRLQQALITSERHHTHGALIFLDLDNFKTLNDTLGHDMGDELLIAVAQRLQQCVRADDIIARLGGDEFIVVLNYLGAQVSAAAQQAERVARKIIECLHAPYTLRGHVVRSTPSLGLAMFYGQSSNVDELLKHADLAMYQAKSAGRNTLRFFNQAMQHDMNAHAQMERDLYLALEREEFLLHYQPQINAAGQCIGVEALLRWPHPEKGFISPAEFIPIAEQSGHILALGRWVIEAACRQQAAWQAQADTAQLKIAINISPRQFRAPHFVADLQACIQKTGANPACLELELTESILLTDIDEAVTTMQALQAVGVYFALDDFGTGYSSFAYLKRLPLRQLKIDQSFVRDILTDANDRAICRSIIAMAKSLGLRVIAEGVETASQWQLLREDGCEEGQGYLFARPLPPTALQAWLRESAAPGQAPTDA